MSEPITREETYLAAIAGDGVDLPNPITREEMYLAAAAGMAVELPNPITRKEQFLQRVVETGGTGGGGVTIRNQNKTITQNGQYKADSGYTGLGTVTVNVPQEDPILQDKTATQNGKYTADGGFDGLGTVTVAVPEPVLQDKTVTANGTVTADSGYDGLGTVTVNVAASGGGADIARAMADATITAFADDEITAVRDSAFLNCSELLTVNMPNVTHLPNNVFKDCTKLAQVNVPNLKTMWASVFMRTALEEIDLNQVQQITTNVFYGTKTLKRIVLRKTDSIVTMGNKNSFDSTPFASGGTGGTVYVPSALISAYQTATNWSTLYAAGSLTFAAIEGSEYE